MSYGATLEDAILLAIQAHRGQVEKAGQPYCLHLLRVMLRLDSELERMAGVLHDIVEDTPYTLADLRQMGYPAAVVEALDCLMRRDGETYDEFLERIKTDRLARRVKIADLEDNMDLRRLPRLVDADVARMNRYRSAWADLKRLEA
ncbi:MAG: GTP pyrophosphokinase [Chloroflexi bacterium]|nr:GTP pyrophosphokinase [Chloroflexota bacterium]